MQDQTGYAIIALVMAILWAVFVYSAATMKPKGPRRWTVFAITLLGVCVLAQVLAILARWNVLGDVMIFVATFAGCAALVGGVVYYIRSRPQTFNTEPVEQPTQGNYVAGQYAAEAPAMRKRGRF